MMYELKLHIGNNIKEHIGEVTPIENIKEIGDLKEITKFLRKNIRPGS